MGEARYYMKARWSEPVSQEVFNRVCQLFVEGEAAENCWQDSRSTEPAEFWPTFREKFPQVYELIGSPPDTADRNHELAGKLAFGYKDDRSLTIVDNEIWIDAEVWHFADWQPLADFLVTRFGAIRVQWLSDEYIDPYDLLGG